jgi:hypothetical protein
VRHMAAMHDRHHQHGMACCRGTMAGSPEAMVPSTVEVEEMRGARASC